MIWKKLNKKNRVKIDVKVEGLIADIYAVNTALKCLSVSLICRTWTKAISHNHIAKLGSNADVTDHYASQECYKIGLIKAACKEVRMIQQWI